MSATRAQTDLPDCPHTPAPASDPTCADTLALRRRYVSPGVFMYYKEPLQIVDGFMQYVWDEEGTRYLDAIAGIATVSVGHCHPRLVEAVREQAGRLTHATTVFLHPTMPALAKKLADHLPEGSELEVTYFTNSGSEATDLATFMARVHTGHFDVIALRNGYHGGSQAAMGLTAMGSWKFPSPLAFGVKHATPGYCYRCPYGSEYPSCNVRCARNVAQLIEYETCGKIAGFIAEPIQGAGGVIDPPSEYFKIVYDIVRSHGGLCIADEVQTGFARVGTHFWGFERYDVVPDVVTMAKGIANGAPLGAVTTRPGIAECMKQKLHFSTFGGNPVSMIQGLTTIEIIDSEGVQENAREVGGYFKERLVDLQKSQPLMGDVRGCGLLLGVELVRDLTTKEPATEEAVFVHEGMKDRGVLIGRGGLYGNVLRLKPPLCITKPDVDFLIERLDETLSSVKR